jgi:hypothetical protein
MIKRKRIVPDEEYERRQKEAAATGGATGRASPQPKKRGAVSYVYFTDAEIAAPAAKSST